MRAVMTKIVFMLLLAALFFYPPSIQAQNSTSFTRIGRGDVQAIAWYPDGERLLVSSVAGAWVYTAELQDIAHLPDAYLASLNPDGRFIASVNPQNQIIVYDAVTLEPAETPDLGRFRRVNAISWSPDGRYLAYSVDGFSSNALREDTTVMLWDTREGLVQNYLPLFGGDHLLWSPHGTFLAVYTAAERGLIWRVGDLANRVPFIAPPGGRVRWQDDSTLITYTVSDTLYEVVRWNAETGESSEPVFSPSDADIYAQDGHIVAVDRWNTVELRQSESLEPIFETPPLTSPDIQSQISIMVWSHDEQRLAVGAYAYSRSAPADLAIVDVSSQAVLHQFTDATQTFTHIAWSADDTHLLAVDVRQQLFVYNVGSGALVGTSSAHSLVGEVVAWSPDGTRLAIADTLDTVTIRDLQQNATLATLPNNGSRITRIEWQPDSTRIVLQTMDATYRGAHTVKVWDVSNDSPENITNQFTLRTGIPITDFDFSADGTRLALVNSPYLWLYDVSTETNAFLVRHDFEAAFENMVLSPNADGVIILRDFYGGAQPVRTQAQQTRFYIGLTTFDGRIVGWATENTYVELTWRRWGGSTVSYLDPALSRITVTDGYVTNIFSITLKGTVTFTKQGFLSPNSTYVATIDTAHNGTIWETETGNAIAWITDAANLAWSPDESRIIVQRQDGGLWVMTSQGEILFPLSISPGVLRASGALFWSPNGNQVAYVHDGVIDLWSLGL